MYFSCELFIPQGLTLMVFFVRHLCYPGDSNRCWWPNLWEQRESRIQYSPRTTIFLCGLPDRYVISSRNESVGKPKEKRCKQKERAVHHSCSQRNVFLWLGAKTEQHCVKGKVMLWQWAPEECAFSSDIFLWVTIFCNSASGSFLCCKYSCWLLSLKKCLQKI